MQNGVIFKLYQSSEVNQQYKVAIIFFVLLRITLNELIIFSFIIKVY